MPFDQTEYLSWYIPRIRAAEPEGEPSINLHSSGVPPLEFPEITDLRGNPWAMGPAFESALSTWLGVDPAELAYCPGATGGTLQALLHLGAPGSAFVVEEPIYEPMRRQAERLGPVRRLLRRPDQGWRLDLEAAERVVRPDTSVILITEPHNPSGVFADRAEVLALCALAKRHGAWVLVNEVYRGFADPPEAHPSYHGAADNLIVVSSLSKLFGAYAARLGWLSGDPDVIRPLHSAQMNYSASSAPSAAVGVAMLHQAESLVDEARRRSALVSRVDEWVHKTPGVSWTRPQGPGYGCVALPPETDDQEFVERLHREHRVLMVPGRLWESPGAVRLSWLQCDEEQLRIGLERFG